MDIFEIAMREFVVPAILFYVLVINTQKPLTVFEEAILLDKFVLVSKARVPSSIGTLGEQLPSSQ